MIKVARPVQLVRDQDPVLRPDDPVIGDAVALEQQEEVERVLALVARGDDLADPVRRRVDDARWPVGHALLAPTGDVAHGALVRLVRAADLGDDPPSARAGRAGEIGYAIVGRCIGALAKGQVGDKYAEGLARLKRLVETSAASP